VDAYRGLLNLYGQFELVKGLSYKVNAAVDVTESEDYLFVPQFDLGFFFTEQNGTLDYFKRRWVYWILEHTLTYERSFGRHRVNLLVGPHGKKETTSTLVVMPRGILPANSRPWKLGQILIRPFFTGNRPTRFSLSWGGLITIMPIAIYFQPLFAGMAHLALDATIGMECFHLFLPVGV
jgi:hypothetical protein